MVNFIPINLELLEKLGDIKGLKNLKKLSLILFREIICSKSTNTTYRFTSEISEKYGMENKAHFIRLAKIEDLNKIMKNVYGIKVDILNKDRGEITFKLEIVNNLLFEEVKKTKKTGYYKLDMEELEVLSIDNTFLRYSYMMIHKGNYDFKSQFMKYGKSSKDHFARDLRETIKFIETTLGKIVDEDYRVIDESMRAAELQNIEKEELSRKVSPVTNSIDCSFLDNYTILKVLENNNYNVQLTINMIKGFKDKYRLDSVMPSERRRKFNEIGGEDSLIKYVKSYKCDDTKEDNSKDIDKEGNNLDDIYY